MHTTELSPLETFGETEPTFPQTVDIPPHENVALSNQERSVFADLTAELSANPESPPRGVSMGKSTSATDVMTIRHS